MEKESFIVELKNTLVCNCKDASFSLDCDYRKINKRLNELPFESCLNELDELQELKLNALIKHTLLPDVNSAEISEDSEFIIYKVKIEKTFLRRIL